MSVIPKRPKKYPCKVGTQPWLVILKGGSKPKVGRPISFRRAEHGTKWMSGVVDKINDDGYFFMSLV